MPKTLKQHESSSITSPDDLSAQSTTQTFRTPPKRRRGDNSADTPIVSADVRHAKKQRGYKRYIEDSDESQDDDVSLASAHALRTRTLNVLTASSEQQPAILVAASDSPVSGAAAAAAAAVAASRSTAASAALAAAEAAASVTALGSSASTELVEYYSPVLSAPSVVAEQNVVQQVLDNYLGLLEDVDNTLLKFIVETRTCLAIAIETLNANNVDTSDYVKQSPRGIIANCLTSVVRLYTDVQQELADIKASLKALSSDKDDVMQLIQELITRIEGQIETIENAKATFNQYGQSFNSFKHFKSASPDDATALFSNESARLQSMAVAMDPNEENVEWHAQAMSDNNYLFERATHANLVPAKA